MRMTVIGAGYLGATHAACMAELGHEVLAMDTDEEKIRALRAGQVPFYEPGLSELVARHLATGRLRFTTSYPELGAFGDVHFLCVGTPQTLGEQRADLRYVDAAVDSLAPWLTGPATVVGKSTVPVGTSERLAVRLVEAAPAGESVGLAWNPEFLREGHAIDDTLAPDRVVVGVTDAQSEAALRQVYAPLIASDVPFMVTDCATAELVKVAANSFLATKISFINAMAEVCEAAGADVVDLTSALAHDERIGGRFLVPGLGFGGGCLPKDIRAFAARAAEIGAGQAVSFLSDVDRVNLRRRQRVVEMAIEECGGTLKGRRIAVWGAAFKPGSDDIRDSPALAVAGMIRERGGEVSVYDPRALDKARKAFPELTYSEDVMEVAHGAQLLLHLTDWREFREMNPEAVGRVMATRTVIDGRGALDRQRWVSAGWRHLAPGRPPAPVALSASGDLREMP